MWSSEVLHYLATNSNCHIVLQPGFPRSKLKRDLIAIRNEDGRYLAATTAAGMHWSPYPIAREILDDFIRASLVKQDGGEDSEGRLVFRLTLDGKIRGHDRSSALRELANYVAEHADVSACKGPKLLDESERDARRIRILDVAADLEFLSGIPLSEYVAYARFEALLGALHAEGFYPLQWQVDAVAYAFQKLDN
jgi:hypothetical protein